ncbi:uncharacterized protein BROUX77_003063 [Berkeleyomyces rouxiae]|uniref:uncharacterized protein n=1 Tax=Berkeleyomyces rouxiae TaxID=2035830 RepID=UPI003B7FE23A
MSNSSTAMDLDSTVPSDESLVSNVDSTMNSTIDSTAATASATEPTSDPVAALAVSFATELSFTPSSASASHSLFVSATATPTTTMAHFAAARRSRAAHRVSRRTSRPGITRPTRCWLKSKEAFNPDDPRVKAVMATAKRRFETIRARVAMLASLPDLPDTTQPSTGTAT